MRSSPAFKVFLSKLFDYIENWPEFFAHGSWQILLLQGLHMMLAVRWQAQSNQFFRRPERKLVGMPSELVEKSAKVLRPKNSASRMIDHVHL